MSLTSPVILGLESSCDETAASIVEDGRHVRSNVVATQHDLHEEYAGVVPEIASRAHLERIVPVITEAAKLAGYQLDELDAIAVGCRPGLIGSLLVGVSAAKALAWSLELPLIGVDHIHAHLYSGQLDRELVDYPALGLVVSGGHTSLYRLEDPLEIALLGRTIDDAVGEAFDKAATVLDLGYPGGPAIEHVAREGDSNAHDFPIANLKAQPLDFSFSGLKTALLYAVRGQPVGRGASATFERRAADHEPRAIADFAASFQRAAIQAVTRNVKRALDQQPECRSILAGGGVTANGPLRQALTELAEERSLDLRLPPMPYCVDNAAMIAGLAAHRLAAGLVDDFDLSASPRGSDLDFAGGAAR